MPKCKPHTVYIYDVLSKNGDIKMNLAEKLIYLRKKQGLTQLELAEKLDVSRQAVSRWEVGATIPSTDNLKILGDLYEVPVDYLLNEELESIAKKDEDAQEQSTQELKKKDIFLNRRRIYVGVAVILALLAIIISTSVVHNQNQEQVIPMEAMTTFGEDEFSSVVLPIK